MKDFQYHQRNYLVEFLKKILTTTGWWYRIPILNSSDKNVTLDLCLPHLGTLFGLTEDAMAVVLLEMGLLKRIEKRMILRQ